MAQILLNENPRKNNVREAKLMYGDIVNIQTILKGQGVDFVLVLSSDSDTGQVTCDMIVAMAHI